MNVLLATGPGSNTLFTITVQGSGRPAARLAGQRRITVSLNRLQATNRRLLLAGDTILSITRCEPMGNPPSPPHPDPGTIPNGIFAAPSASEGAPLAVPQAKETVVPPLMGQPPQQSCQGQKDETSFEEDVIVLLLSLLGVVILLTLKVVQHLAQQWETRSQERQRPDPPIIGVQERGSIAQLLRS